MNSKILIPLIYPSKGLINGLVIIFTLVTLLGILQFFRLLRERTC